MLYIVATPIGNLEDITFRAINTLKSVDVIAAEDTRNTLKLLNRYEINTPLFSFHEHSRGDKYEKIYALLGEGKSVALVSDAGTPLISDPGDRLVCGAHERGFKVISIPGACAGISALVCSGISAEKFYFYGFLPKDKSRKEQLAQVCAITSTVILYESPHNLLKTLAELEKLIPERNLCVCRELTKLHEEVLNASVAQIHEHFKEVAPRGEFVLVLEGAVAKTEEATDEEILAEISNRISLGDSKKSAVANTAMLLGVNKNRVYKVHLENQ